MHNEYVFFRILQPLLIDTKECIIFARSREEPYALPFALDPQHIDDIGILQGFIEIIMNGDTHSSQFRLQKCARTDEMYISAHRLEAVNIRPGYTAMVYIPYDNHFQSINMPFDFLNSEQVQKSLCRMFVCTITAIDDDRRDTFAGIQRRTFLFMPHDDGIYAHGSHRQKSITEAFPFLDRAAARREVDDIGIEIFGSHFKRAPRTRTRFPEHVDNRFSL